jgi:hypothetical protein
VGGVTGGIQGIAGIQGGGDPLFPSNWRRNYKEEEMEGFYLLPPHCLPSLWIRVSFVRYQFV